MAEDIIQVVASVVIPYQNCFIYVQTKKDGKFGLPGGKVNPLEDMRVAAPREVSEETGIQVVVDSIVSMIYNKSDHGNTILNVAYSGKIVEGEPKIVEPDKIISIEYLSLKKVRELYQEGKIRGGLANVRPLEDYLAGIRLPLETIQCLL